MVIAFVGSVIEFNALHPKKAEAPIDVIPLGIVIEDKAVHAGAVVVPIVNVEKAEAPIAVILVLELFIVIEVIVLLPLNIYGGIVVPVTEAVIVTLLLVLLIPANAYVATLVMLFGMVIVFNARHP